MSMITSVRADTTILSTDVLTYKTYPRTPFLIISFQPSWELKADAMLEWTGMTNSDGAARLWCSPSSIRSQSIALIENKDSPLNLYVTREVACWTTSTSDKSTPWLSKPSPSTRKMELRIWDYILPSINRSYCVRTTYIHI